MPSSPPSNSTMDSAETHREAAGDFKPGSIRRIHCKNFLTYEEAVCTPGCRLNVVIGANGTGKSTILNAICLGLGGEPKLLGRADDVRDYVRSGCRKGEVEIELEPNPGSEPHVLKRVIDRERGSDGGNGRGSSTFYINDKKVTAKDVQQLVRNEYNITIDNMCTFLPQDKVGNFSGISPQDLLLETEKTLSKNQEFHTTHLELIEAEKNLGSSDDDVETLQAKLKKLQHENEQLERAKELLEERQEALRLMELLQKKKMWLEFEHLRATVVDLKQQRDEGKLELKKALAELKPLQDDCDRLKSKQQLAYAKHREYSDQIKKSTAEFDKGRKKYESHDDQIDSLIADLMELDTVRANLEARVKKEQDRVDGLALQQKDLPSQEVLQKDFDAAKVAYRELHKEYEAAKTETRGLERELHDMEEKGKHSSDKVAKLNDDAARRRERIFRQFGDLARIANWIDNNRNKFRRPVYGPIACEMLPQSREAAMCLEAQIPQYMLKSFVVETQQDYDLLYRCIREEMRIPINILQVDRNQRLDQAPQQYSDRKMATLKREHGIVGMLDELFTAPDPVRQALQDVAVHKALMGSQRTIASIESKGLIEFLTDSESGGGRKSGYCLYAPTTQNGRPAHLRYQGSVSRYNGKVSSRQDHVREAQLLKPGVDPQEKERAEEHLAQVQDQIAHFRPKLQEAEKKKSLVETRTQDARANFDAARERKNAVGQFETKWKMANDKLDRAKAELSKDDVAPKREKIKAIQNRIHHSLSSLEKRAELQDEIIDRTRDLAGVEATKCVLSNQVRAAEQAMHDVKRSTEDKQKSLVSIDEQFKKSKKRAFDKKKQVEKEAPITDENGEKTPLGLELDELACEDLHEAEVAIEDAEKKANSIDANPDAIRQYEERKKQIEDLEAQLEMLTEKKSSERDALAQKRTRWEGALVNKLTDVNKLFSHYMGEMDCVGEVTLYRGRDEEEQGEDEQEPAANFKNWGIQIRVSFREGTKAQVLSAQRHSGGERSVSTIMYLMALQDMMVAPFRCVDEINQGLDERNERLVFSRIVENSCQPPSEKDRTNHSGQYFLITPKLLPNLLDMETQALTVLFVMNGPHNFEKPEDWNPRHFVSLRTAKRGLEDDGNDEENRSNIAPASRGGKKSRLSTQES